MNLTPVAAASPRKSISPASATAPEMVGPFQLGNCIGKGAFASVYRALNVTNGNIVAMKKFDCRAIIIPTTSSDDKDKAAAADASGSSVFLESLQQEIAILAKLSHPNIVSYYECITTPDYIYLVLEYVENGSLLSSLQAFSGRFPESLVSVYTRQILSGLAYLHSKGVVHCDIKAANILTTKTGIVKLTDFGVSLRIKTSKQKRGQLARSLSQGHEITIQQQLEDANSVDPDNDAVGTPFWMAPEVIQLKGPRPPSDIWSLGCTVIEMLTGKPPYFDLAPLSAIYHIVEDSDDAIIPEEGCSKDLEKFLRRCLYKVPEKRSTAVQLLRHPFITGYGASESSPASDVIDLSPEKPLISQLEKVAIASPASKKAPPLNVSTMARTLSPFASDTNVSDLDLSLLNTLANLPSSPDQLDYDEAVALLRSILLTYHDSVVLDSDLHSILGRYISETFEQSEPVESLTWIQMMAIAKLFWPVRRPYEQVIEGWKVLEEHVSGSPSSSSTFDGSKRTRNSTVSSMRAGGYPAAMDAYLRSNGMLSEADSVRWAKAFPPTAALPPSQSMANIILDHRPILNAKILDVLP